MIHDVFPLHKTHHLNVDKSRTPCLCMVKAIYKDSDACDLMRRSSLLSLNLLPPIFCLQTFYPHVRQAVAFDQRLIPGFANISMALVTLA